MSNEEIVEKLRNGENSNLILPLMNQNQGFIYVIAKPFLRAGNVDGDELPSVAFLATWRAVFEASDTTIPFLTSLKYSLLTELITAADNNADVSLPRNLRWQIRKYTLFVDDFLSRSGRQPTDKEIISSLKIGSQQLETLKVAIQSQQVGSLNAPISSAGEDGEAEAGSYIPSDVNVEEQVIEDKARRDLRILIDAILSSLPKDESESIREKYFRDTTPTDAKAYKCAMKKLREPRIMRALSVYANENFFRGSGLENFKVTQTSKPEGMVIAVFGESKNE